jgi:hypothetical protein
MIRRAGLGWLIAIGLVSAAVAALHQPRPAIAAATTGVVVMFSGARRLALFACLLVAFGLIAASPQHDRHPAAVSR